MTTVVFTKFEARLDVAGPFSLEAQYFDPMCLLKVALQLALFSQSPDAVSKLITDATEAMLHSLSCKRRKPGEVVVLRSNDLDGYNGLYQIVEERDTTEDCFRCGNPLCKEWPNLRELSPEGTPTGKHAYHVAECQMTDPLPEHQTSGFPLGTGGVV